MNAPLYDGASANIPSISTFNDSAINAGCATGRFATRRWQKGDEIPLPGAMVFISGANQDAESDQHRQYSWRRVIGVTDSAEDFVFICLQRKNCWPTVERLENCWIAEIVDPV